MKVKNEELCSTCQDQRCFWQREENGERKLFWNRQKSDGFCEIHVSLNHIDQLVNFWEQGQTFDCSSKSRCAELLPHSGLNFTTRRDLQTQAGQLDTESVFHDQKSHLVAGKADFKSAVVSLSTHARHRLPAEPSIAGQNDPKKYSAPWQRIWLQEDTFASHLGLGAPFCLHSCWRLLQDIRPLFAFSPGCNGTSCPDQHQLETLTRTWRILSALRDTKQYFISDFPVINHNAQSKRKNYRLQRCISCPWTGL